MFFLTQVCMCAHSVMSDSSATPRTSLPGSSVRGFPRQEYRHFFLQEIFPTRDRTCIFCIGWQILYCRAIRERNPINMGHMHYQKKKKSARWKLNISWNPYFNKVITWSPTNSLAMWWKPLKKNRTHRRRANTRQPGNNFCNTFYVPGWGKTRKPGPVLSSTDWRSSTYKAPFPRTCNNCRNLR